MLKGYLTSLLFRVSYISLKHLHLLYSYCYNVLLAFEFEPENASDPAVRSRERVAIFIFETISRTIIKPI